MFSGSKRRTSVLSTVLAFLLIVNIVVGVAGVPAFASERELTCTRSAHTHGKSCYTEVELTDAERVDCNVRIHNHSADCLDADGELVCGKADYIIHSHNEFCFDADGSLICALAGRCKEAHSHSPACYNDRKELVCELPEIQAHTHSKNCYRIVRTESEPVLSCTLPEAPVHTHTDSCYAVSEHTSSSDAELVCTVPEGHAHGDGCYTTTESSVTELVCTLPEVKAHNHSAVCISESIPLQKTVLSCTMSEHVHGDACYGAPASSSDAAVSGTDAATAPLSPTDAVSAADVSASDVISGSDAADASDVVSLFSSLIVSLPVLTAQTPRLEPDTITEAVVPAGATVVYYFTPELTHNYDFAFTFPYHAAITEIYDENNNTLFSEQYPYATSTSATVQLTAGKTYSLKMRHNLSSNGTFTVLYSIADYHDTFIDGRCSCGLKEEDLFGSYGSNTTWSFKDGVLTVSGSGDMPNTSSGAPWKNISGAIEKVVISDGITHVGNNAFRSCCSLKSIELAPSVNTIGHSAFRSCTSLTAVTIPGTVVSIDSYAFAECSALESVVFLDGLLTIESYAFKGSSSLTSISLPDSLQSIGESAFPDCSVSELRLPASLTSIGRYAFKSIENLYIDSANLASITSSPVYITSAATGLTIGSKVDVIDSSLSSFINSLTGVTRVDFAGENNFTLKYDIKLTGNNPLLDKGEYYVDEQGVLYYIYEDSSRAELRYVPDNLTEYTVPATIPADDGTECTVDSVANNSVFHADSLESIDFEAPEAITSLSDGALANCMTLEKVNGAGTVEEAFATFPNAGTTGSEPVFINTGLEDGSKVVDGEISIYGNDTGLSPLIKVVTHKNSGTNNPDFADTYTFYTGEYAKITIGMSNANTGDYEAVRVYFAFDSNGGALSWPFGSQTFASDMGITYNIKTARSSVENVFYIECPRLEDGDTLSVNMNVLYPSGKTSGGKVNIWPVVLGEGEVDRLGNGVVPSNECNQAEWVTKADDFSVIKKEYTINTPAKIVGHNGEIYVSNLAYDIELARNGSTLTGIGKDFMKSIDFTDTLTPGEGLEWDEDVINAVRSGNVRITTTENKNHTVYVIIGGKEYRFCTLTGYNIINISVGLSADNKLQIKWTRYNDSPDRFELSSPSITLVFCCDEREPFSVGDYDYEPTYLNCSNAAPEQTYTITNRIDATEHFSYSEDQFDSHEISKTLATGTASLEITKDLLRPIPDYLNQPANYDISITNDSAFAFPDLEYINDPLPSVLYISPDNIQKMFDEFLQRTDYLKEMSIELTEATLCRDTDDAYTPGYEITATDGSKRLLTHADSGVGTNHSGCESSDPSVYDTNATLLLTCKADGSQTLTFNGRVIDAGNVLQALESVGYVVTADVKYELNWVFVDGYDLPAGADYTIKIYATIKNSFMLTSIDRPERILGSPFRLQNNYAYIWYREGISGEPVSKSARSGFSNMGWDYVLSKTAVINSDSRLTSVVNGDVIDYSILVNYYGGQTNETLPLIDHMQGAQVLIVPEKGNEHLADYGLTTQEIGGVSMYALNKPGVYRSVTVAGKLADSVTVTAMDGGGFDTLTRWYFAGYSSSSSYTVTALVDTQSTGVTATTYTLTNETWLNDHQTHRLWTAAGSGNGIGGSSIAFQKYIVTEKGDTPENDVLDIYSPIRKGQPTLYRLSLKALSGTVTISGDLIYDALPKTFHEAFMWSKDNVTLSYVAAENSSYSISGVASEDESWFVDSVPPAWGGTGKTEDQQFIRWSDDMRLSITGELYIYVTLQMPDGDAWADNAAKYRLTRLENSFWVLGEKKTVFHYIAETAEAYLQKGVWDTGLDKWLIDTQSADYSVIRNTPDSRQYFLNSTDLAAQIVTYYVVLYNSGPTRLYLSEIQDALPEGVIPWTQFYYGSVSSTYSNFYPCWTNGTVDIFDEEGNKLNPKWRSFTVSPSFKESTNTLTLRLTNGENRDDHYNKYYLNPNEGVKILIPCYVDKRDRTGDAITNTVAMPYFDYLGEGAVISSDTMVVGTNIRIPNAAPNDGGCEIIGTAEANLLGMTGGNSGTQWLSSNVTMRRGDIVPGITKRVKNLTTHDGNTVQETETAGTLDTVNWEVILTNSGTDNIYGWTFTDAVNPDYCFTGLVDMDLRTGSNRYSVPLFDLQRNPDDLDDISITYNSSSGYKAHKGYVRGSGPIELDINLTRSYITLPSYIVTSKVSLEIYVDENGCETLSFTILNNDFAISPDGSVEIILPTKIFGTWANKVYYNNAYLTPLTQTYDERRITQGNHVLFGDEKAPSVKSSAQITTTYGYVTSSEQRIHEVGNEANSASSREEKNWILLDSYSDVLRYTNIVKNVTDRSISDFVMINNLPEVGDHTTFAATEERFSEFNVELHENPDFEISINLDGSKTVLTPDQYTLMFSDSTEFSGEDWKGSRSVEWYALPRATTRSFRLEIHDDTGAVIPDKSAIHVAYNCRITVADDYADDNVTADPGEGSIAWNSFGYHYSVLGENISLEAAPLKVGARIQYVPAIKKSLVYPDGSEFHAASDQTFRFLVYSGKQVEGLTGKTEKEAAELLAQNNRSVFVAELTVKAGESSSDIFRLGGQKVMTYDAESGTWVSTGTDFTFTNGEYFTVLEIDNTDDAFVVRSIGSSSSDSFSSVYSGNVSTTITAVNEKISWTARINKIDAAEGKPLAGAVFGLYSSAKREQISDEDYDALGLERSPDRTIKHNGVTWYLSQVMTTGTGGAAIFTGLTESAYIARELQAPGGYRLSKDIIEFSDADADSELVCSVVVENHSYYELPKTGTSGAATFIALGNIMMLAAAALFVFRKRLYSGEAE